MDDDLLKKFFKRYSKKSDCDYESSYNSEVKVDRKDSSNKYGEEHHKQQTTIIKAKSGELGAKIDFWYHNALKCLAGVLVCGIVVNFNKVVWNNLLGKGDDYLFIGKIVKALFLPVVEVANAIQSKENFIVVSIFLLIFFGIIKVTPKLLNKLLSSSEDKKSIK